MSDELTVSFLGALQASLSVLLVTFYGVIAAQFRFLEESTTKQISSLCIRMLLPALLATNVGSQLQLDTGLRYVPILIWGLFYASTSLAFGCIMTRFFKMPYWTTPAISFNNTSSLPLILIESLGKAGVLDSLLVHSDDTVSAAVHRARSYFLVNAIVGDSLTFALGPKLLHGEEVPEHNGPQTKRDDNGHPYQEESSNDEEDEHNETPNEQTSLLPIAVVRSESALARGASSTGSNIWSRLPSWTRNCLSFAYAFVHAPLLGGLTGAILGLVPPFHKAFFNDPQNGGIFSAWLTDSIQKIGELFPALMTVVVGVKLSNSLRKMRSGEDSADVPWPTATLILCVRFVVWPAISITCIYLFASRTQLLSRDPMLWFAMMLMPTGPTAMKLTALADVSGSGEAERMSIAKFLALSYVISPVICFTVVGALKACHAAMNVS